jgi:pyruvate dehydrogenase E1 component alpha subunit
MHIADPDTGNLGANAIVGGSAGIATGAALSAKRLKTDRVAVCFFGDGAMGQGLLYEVMNMASLWKLPVIYVCENNLYGEYTSNSETLAGDMLTRAAGFGIQGQAIDGQDVRKVYATARDVVDRVRRGAGPAFLVCNTYRFMGHHVGDVNREYYRSKQEEQLWKTERDPVRLMADRLAAEGLADRARLDRMLEEVKSEVEKAVEFAVAAPYPSVDKVDQDVYA